MASTKKSPTSQGIYQLHIALLDITPMFRRRLWMAGNLKLSKLERVIQEAFGWTNSHLVAFRIAGERFGMTDIESVDGDENLNDCSGSYDQTTKSWSMDTKPPGVVERKPSFAGGNRRENC